MSKCLGLAGAARMGGDTKPVGLFGNSVRISRIRELTGLMVRDAVTFDITIIPLFVIVTALVCANTLLEIRKIKTKLNAFFVIDSAIIYFKKASVRGFETGILSGTMCDITIESLYRIHQIWENREGPFSQS